MGWSPTYAFRQALFSFLAFEKLGITPVATLLTQSWSRDRSRHWRSVILDLFAFLLLLCGLTWLMDRGVETLGYHWQWYRIPRHIFTFSQNGLSAGPILEGLLVTVKIVSISMVLFLVIGLATALLRLARSRLARWVARVYLEVIRNTPLLIQLFFVYFVLSPVLGIDRFTSGVLALSLFEGAYASEIFRASILSVPESQREAAYALGMSRFEALRWVVFPQAARVVLPPLTGQMVALVKDSALVSTIAIYDLTMQGQAIIAETYLTFEIWFTIAAIYLAMTLSLSLLSEALMRRQRLWAGDVGGSRP
jgi:polar amino acid transport system permease protein